jgi:protein-S-isoprenylcysteine O-methyltransferase Ste14
MIRAGTLVELCWGALGLYWLATMLDTKKIAVNESAGLRVFRLTILALILALLLTDWLQIGPLAWRFLPPHSWLIWLGVVLTAVGCSLAIWARATLGRNWSDKVVLKVDHELIRTGPYRYLRHPIYSGVLIAVAGTAIKTGELRGVVALILLGTNYYIKATREEKILAVNFGQSFAEHKRRTGFFLPGL